MRKFFVNIISFFLKISRVSHILFSFFIFVCNNLLVLHPLKKGFVRKLSQLMIAFIEFLRLKFIRYDLPILLTYDFSISPLTYGDFLIAIFLARFFSLHSRKVYLYIPNCNSTKFIDEFKSFSLSLGQDVVFVECPDHLASILSTSNVHRLFQWSFLSPSQPFSHYFNLLNLLLVGCSKSFLEDFLLDYSHFPSFVPPFSQYISLHCRYTPPSSPLFHLETRRNTNSSTFLSTVSSLRKIYPNMPIVVITCDEGRHFLSDVVSQSNLPLVSFSKPNSNFFDEIPYVLFSEAYFQLNGGGIAVISLFSSVSYLICFKALANEVPFTPFRLCSWARRDQICRQIMFNAEFYSCLRFFKL